ncbi:MAG TPA: hypothetical protein VFU22_31245 [Roseiflexaceae bacterium]|nr:hypothetical protein [Roseiflexaceae bacterium]
MSTHKSYYAAGLKRQIWRGIATVLAVLVLLAPSLAFAQTVTGTFLGKGTGREVAFQHNGKAHNDWAGTLKFRIDGGPDVSVFCIQIEVRVRTGDRYRSDGPVLALPNGCQIRYLLDKYPASTTNTADEAAARQMAIWVFSDGVDPTTIEDAAIRDRTLALVAEARQGPCSQSQTEAPDLTLEPQNATPAAGQTVAYTVRAGAADAGKDVTISVSGPAVLTDAAGAGSGQQQQQVTLNAQGVANFWVTGTGQGDAFVRVELPYRLDAGTVFSHIEGPPTQRLVLAESKTLAATVTGTLAVSAPVPQPSATAPAPQPPTATVPASAPQPPTATASAPAPQPSATPAPPTPTRRPTRDDDNDETPEATEQPTQVVTSGEEATAVPTQIIADQTAVPEGAPIGEQPTPVNQAVSAEQAPPAGAAGGAPVVPRSLPNTSAPDTPSAWLIGVSAGLFLVLGGWMLRRR